MLVEIAIPFFFYPLYVRKNHFHKYFKCDRLNLSNSQQFSKVVLLTILLNNFVNDLILALPRIV